MIKVIARRGVRVPTEYDARRYITDADAVSVESTPYILRRLREGDLLLAPAAASPTATDDHAGVTHADSDIPVVEVVKGANHE